MPHFRYNAGDVGQHSRVIKKQVITNQAPASDTGKPREGAFLLSLDSDLKQEQRIITWAILVQSLFSRRVCLTDTQLIESLALQAFFFTNRKELNEEAELAAEQGRLPMFGALVRQQAPDIAAVLDSMLAPNPRTGVPTYLSRLKEEQNIALRERLSRAASTDERREVLYSVAEPPFKAHISRVSHYFQQNRLSTIRAVGPSQATLFPFVRENLAVLDQPWNRRWMNEVDLVVRDALIKEMDANPDHQTRERLHLAIYAGNLPHYVTALATGLLTSKEVPNPRFKAFEIALKKAVRQRM